MGKRGHYDWRELSLWNYEQTVKGYGFLDLSEATCKVNSLISANCINGPSQFSVQWNRDSVLCYEGDGGTTMVNTERNNLLCSNEMKECVDE